MKVFFLPVSSLLSSSPMLSLPSPLPSSRPCSSGNSSLFVLAVISLVSLGPRLRHFIIRTAVIARCLAQQSGQLRWPALHDHNSAIRLWDPLQTSQFSGSRIDTNVFPKVSRKSISPSKIWECKRPAGLFHVHCKAHSFLRSDRQESSTKNAHSPRVRRSSPDLSEVDFTTS